MCLDYILERQQSPLFQIWLIQRIPATQRIPTQKLRSPLLRTQSWQIFSFYSLTLSFPYVAFVIVSSVFYNCFSSIIQLSPFFFNSVILLILYHCATVVSKANKQISFLRSVMHCVAFAICIVLCKLFRAFLGCICNCVISVSQLLHLHRTVKPWLLFFSFFSLSFFC